jgi:hypothetical protein
MITLDPDTAQPNPEVMRRLDRDHEGKAGIYGAVLVEGTIRLGDEIALLDSGKIAAVQASRHRENSGLIHW